MYLEKINGGYFAYCRFCLQEKNCELRHNEFLEQILPDDAPEACKGMILRNPDRNVLVCEDCGAVIEKLPENKACGRFIPDLTLWLPRQRPLIKPQHKVVVPSF